MKLNENDKSSGALAGKIIVIVFLASYFCVLAYPVADPDVFWHIKTGEWIWHHKSLPETDPFSYTVDDSVYDTSLRPSVILRQYWLSQLILYGLHSSFGLYGIILFRFLIYTSLLGLLYFWMKKKGVHQISAFFFLLPFFLILLTYEGERPNTLSYLLAASVFYFVDEFISGENKKGILLPLLMVIWSFLHGGFLLGEVLLSIYLALMIFRRITGRCLNTSFFRKAVILVISIASPFIFSKSAWETVKMMIYETSNPLAALYKNTIVEAVSPLTNAGANIGIIACMIFMILLLTVVIRRLSAEHIIFIAFLLGISLMSVRYYPFFLIFGLPVAAFHWSARPSFDLTNKVFRFSMYVTVLFCAIFLGQAGFNKSFFLKGIISSYYPKDAVSFMKTAKPNGNMFNSYTWGGYLIYELYPGQKVFIDPRALSLPLFAKYHSLDVMAKNAENVWKNVLEEYHISVVLIPSYNNADGKFTMLTKKLVDDPDWSLVFIGQESAALIFFNREACNVFQIEQYSLKKEAAFEKALKDLKKESDLTQKWRGDLQIAVVSIFLKRYKDAEHFLENALDRNDKLVESSVGRVLTVLKRGEYTSLDDEELYKIWAM